MLRRIRAARAAQGWDLNVCSHGSTEICSWPHADFAHFWTGTSLALVLQTWELEAQTKAVEASLEEQAVTREMLARQTKALALGALAQVVSIQLEAKHRGFGSGELKLQMDTLERLAHGIRKELESGG
jgi:hypothetical protein